MAIDWDEVRRDKHLRDITKKVDSIQKELKKLNQTEENHVLIEAYHVVGRLIAGSLVLMVGKYILNVWGS